MPNKASNGGKATSGKPGAYAAPNPAFARKNNAPTSAAAPTEAPRSANLTAKSLMKTSAIVARGNGARHADGLRATPAAKPKARKPIAGHTDRKAKIEERIAAAAEELEGGITDAASAAEELRRSMEQIASGAE